MLFRSNRLDLPIPLGISWGRISIRNSQITAISPERFAIKLKAIVWDEGIRDPELGDNIFPNKLLDVHISDIRQGLSFNLLNKVVSANQQIPFVLCCLGERANDI